MALTEPQIESVAAEANRLFAAAAPRSGLEKTLRAAFPDLRITVCSEEDVNVKPYREEAGYQLHLIGGDGHCLSLTRDPGSALGLVLAIREEE